MKLDELSAPKGAKKNKKRIGCGPGSGHGKTACRGSKGQRARSGTKSYPWFEGGQMPLQRRVPKRGFTNIFKTVYQIVNVKDLKRFPADSEVDVDKLRASGLIKKTGVKVKLLGDGEIDRPLRVAIHACTPAAKQRVEQAGGEVRLLDK